MSIYHITSRLRKFTLGFNELESTRRNADNVSGTESQLHYTPN